MSEQQQPTVAQHEAIWNMELAIHRGEIDGVMIESASGSCSMPGTWDDFGLQENCREFIAQKNEFVELDQVEVLSFSYVVLPVDGAGFPV